MVRSVPSLKAVFFVASAVFVRSSHGFVGPQLPHGRLLAPTLGTSTATSTATANSFNSNSRAWPFSVSMANVDSDNESNVELIESNDVSLASASASAMTSTMKSMAPLLSAMAIVVLLTPLASNAVVDLSLTDLSPSRLSALTTQLTDSGFYQAFSLVFLSEIGDKTFFVAGLLAAKLSRFISFVGSLGALAVMSIISVVIGQLFHAVPAGIANGLPLDDIAAVLAFSYFGVKILTEALEMDEGGKTMMDEELEEAEEVVGSSDTGDTKWAQIASIFALVFAAEFGDRSFIATIALSAAQNPVSVATGAIAAHAVATGIAVVGGAYIAKYVPERVLGIIGGLLFLVFAATTAFGIF